MTTERRPSAFVRGRFSGRSASAATVSVIHGPRRRTASFAHADRGQAFIEFALLLPIVMMIVVGLMEFAIFMNARNAVEFAARDGSVLGAEGGNTPGTDCVILDKVERDIVAPATNIRIQTVNIFWSDKNGDQIGTNTNTYTRTGSLTCNYGGGATLTVPYTLTNGSYLEGARCDVLAGCGGSHPGLDTIGVRVTYQHRWITTVAQHAGGTITFSVGSATRLEPQQ
jgi:Flp pilus assembly protein TadG